LLGCLRTRISFASRRSLVSSCLAPKIEFAISFCCVKASSSPRFCAGLLFANSFINSGEASAALLLVAFHYHFEHISRFCTRSLTQSLVHRHQGRTAARREHERKGKPFIVPRTGTRPRTGGVIAATTPATFPWIFPLKRSFFSAIPVLPVSGAGKL
jgi:hypothetical protein